MSATEDRASAYASYLGRLSAETVGELDRFVSDDVHFKDPFNDVHGRDRMRQAFAAMFDIADEVRFEVRETACNGSTCFLLWDFACMAKRGKEPWLFRRVSEVRFDSEGRVASHIDHFDAGSQFYARLPVLGRLIRFVQKRLEVS